MQNQYAKNPTELLLATLHRHFCLVVGAKAGEEMGWGARLSSSIGSECLYPEHYLFFIPILDLTTHETSNKHQLFCNDQYIIFKSNKTAPRMT
jgi:hypothetical protein